jgi:hypothetical protein
MHCCCSASRGKFQLHRIVKLMLEIESSLCKFFTQALEMFSEPVNLPLWEGEPLDSVYL